ncbi:hypothetical protein H8E07_07720 [bacterium]|nr:hypothetical protein [bacterium]
MGRCVRHLSPTLCLLLLLSAVAAGAAPRITSVAPAGRDSLLLCRLTTEGLPGERIVSTLRSGLVSAVELKLEVRQGDDRSLAGHHVMMLLSYDLWEEVFAVNVSGEEARFPDLESLRTYLSAMPPLPVAPLSILDGVTPAVIRAGLRLHPIAPDTRGRMEEMISGESTTRGGHGDAVQEVSISLGKLIRFFYKGDGDSDMDVTRDSAPFRPGELTHEPD